MNKATIFLFTAIVTSQSFAGVGGLTGYYGFEDPVADQKLDENKTSVEKYARELRPKIEAAIKHPDKYTVTEYSELITKARQLSITTMDKNDIENSLKIQNVAMQRSDEYSKKVSMMKLEKPELDITRDMAKSRFSREAERDIKKASREKFWKENIDRIGIVTFIDPSAYQNNEAQRKVLQILALEYPKLDIRVLDKVSYAKMIKRLGVINYPDTWMVYRSSTGEPKWYRVANGMSAKNQILDGIDEVYQFYIAGENVIK